MSTVVKNRTIKKGFGPAIISAEVKNYDEDSFVIKKVEKAKETLQKVGLPNLKKK